MSFLPWEPLTRNEMIERVRGHFEYMADHDDRDASRTQADAFIAEQVGAPADGYYLVTERNYVHDLISIEGPMTGLEALIKVNHNVSWFYYKAILDAVRFGRDAISIEYSGIINVDDSGDVVIETAPRHRFNALGGTEEILSADDDAQCEWIEQVIDTHGRVFTSTIPAVVAAYKNMEVNHGTENR